MKPRATPTPVATPVAAPSTGAIPSAVEALLIQQEQPLNKLQETARYVSPGFERPVGYWLLTCSGLVAGVICLGGYTRLTESGLSITEWNLTGRAYPKNEEEWDKEFIKYKETLEYKQVHFGMTLQEFKTVYFNEWFHRLAARGVSLFFGFGAFYFWGFRRCFTWRMTSNAFTLGNLFVAQGLLGWWMTKSGFEQRTEEIKTPRVSPYRLAVHLVFGTVLFAGLLNCSLKLLLPPSCVHLTLASARAAISSRRLARVVFWFAPTTFISGAFVAGNDAGHSNNTWPKMAEGWIPKEFRQIKSNWKHIFENDSVVQFIHRMLAYSTVIAHTSWFLYCSKLPLSSKPRKFARLMAATSNLQAFLGIATLLMYVPVPLGVLHQAMGLAVLSSSLLSLHCLRLPVWWARAIN